MKEKKVNVYIFESFFGFGRDEKLGRKLVTFSFFFCTFVVEPY